MATHSGGYTQRTSSPLLRTGVPGEKKPLKEKLISYYEQIFEVDTAATLAIQNFCKLF